MKEDWRAHESKYKGLKITLVRKYESNYVCVMTWYEYEHFEKKINSFWCVFTISLSLYFSLQPQTWLRTWLYNTFIHTVFGLIFTKSLGNLILTKIKFKVYNDEWNWLISELSVLCLCMHPISGVGNLWL